MEKKSVVDLYLVGVYIYNLLLCPNGKEEWLADLYLLCVPNGNEEWLVDLYPFCVPNGMRSVS